MGGGVAVDETKNFGSVLVVDGERRAGHALLQDRAVRMSLHATARDSQRALEQVLAKPFDASELLQAVDSAAQSAGGFSASLHGISIVDMLQMFHYSRRSLTLRVLGDIPAAIHMRDGELVHAEYAERRGEDAIAAILKMPAGAVQTGALESQRITVQRKFQTVMLDQLRRQDEELRGSEPPHVREVTDEMFGFLPDEQAPSAAKTPNPNAISGEWPIARLGRESETVDEIDLACKRMVCALEGGVASGVIDLDSGNLLGIYTQRDGSEQQNELLAEAAVALFRGPHVQRIEAMLGEQRGERENGEYFEEIQLASQHHLHFAKALKGGRAVILLVTERNTSLGIGWAQLKSALPILERLIP